MMLDPADPLYRYYLSTQINDGPGEEPTQIYVNFIKTLIPVYQWAGKRVLDVGARLFYTHTLLGELGAIVDGIDIGAQCLEICAKEGRPCRNLDAHFLDKEFGPETLDFVYSTHSLEHWYDPYTVLRKIYAALKPGGLFFLAVPSPCGVDPDPAKREGHWVAIESDEQVAGWLVDAGFNRDKFKHSAHYVGELRGADEYVVLVEK